MTKPPPPKDIGASVRARLLNLARARGEDVQLVLTRYANERLLFRIASSRHGQSLVLKGAALFTLWTGKPHRATRDLDLLGFGDPGVDRMREVFAEVLALDVADDGVRFDLGTLVVGLIREEQEYGGVRCEFVARITNAQVRLQVDVGFGDAITPEASIVEFPPLLEFPAPRLRAYPRETVVAEKLDAMVQLGMANSRMKDFYDVWICSKHLDFNDGTLFKAVDATFKNRKTTIPIGEVRAFTTAFAERHRVQWNAFAKKVGEDDLVDAFERIAEDIRIFAMPVFVWLARGHSTAQNWKAGRGWVAEVT